jgi:hypothetical protein
MAVTICHKLTKLFPPTWQHHHLTITSTIAPIILWEMSLRGSVTSPALKIGRSQEF